MSMAEHVDRIMLDKKSYIRIHVEGVPRYFSTDLSLDGRKIDVHVETIQGLLPRDMADPVVMRASDGETFEDIIEPEPFDSLKAFLGTDLLALIATGITEMENEEIERI